ncbi:MAG: pyrroloquinoline quinone biosynthesis peptide chaperone PqqD [Alphaproteobacteria bacterium]|nr:pyrroloquinoline quinone biosynthesis peptide chaperone PqqD [Alphaproteobacteria bacterium]
MEPIKVGATSRIVLPRHVKLKHDTVRDRWILLAPERVLNPDETSLEIVRMLDGVCSVGDIVGTLAVKYNAPSEVILVDVIGMLQDLCDKGFLVSAETVATHAGRTS